MYQCFNQKTNRLEPRSGPTCVGPDLGSSLFVSSSKKEIIEIWRKLSFFKRMQTTFFKAAILYPSKQWFKIVEGDIRGDRTLDKGHTYIQKAYPFFSTLPCCTKV